MSMQAMRALADLIKLSLARDCLEDHGQRPQNSEGGRPQVRSSYVLMALNVIALMWYSWIGSTSSFVVSLITTTYVATYRSSAASLLACPI